MISFLAFSEKSLKIPKGQSESYIKEEQTTQCPKEKVQKDKQRSTKHTYKTKDRVIRTPLKTGGELRCSGRVNSSYSTSYTRRVNEAGVARFLVFCVVFCTSLFLLLYFFFLLLYCLSFFNLRLLIISLWYQQTFLARLSN
jgi:hypothetical protein